MKINYTLTNKPVISTSALVKSTLEEALFYSYKEHNHTSFKLKVNKEDLDLSSKIYKVETLKKSLKVYCNTTDVLFTNISVDGVQYYYEVVSLPSHKLDLDLIRLKTNLDIVELNGRFYTNSIVANFEVIDNVFVFSKPVIDPDLSSVKFTSKNIQLTVPRTNSETVYCKLLSDSVLNVKYVSANKVLLPSFYLEKRGKVFKYVEGDVLTINKREYTDLNSNYVNLKDKAISVDYKHSYLDKQSNILFIEETLVDSGKIFINYLAKRSSHLLNILNDSIDISLEDGIVKIVEGIGDITIYREIDTSKVHLIPNDYLNRNEFKFKATDIQIRMADKTVAETDRRMFLKDSKAKHSVSPSQNIYLALDKKKIYQKSSDNASIVEKTSLEDIYELLEDDYEKPLKYATSKPLVSVRKIGIDYWVNL